MGAAATMPREVTVTGDYTNKEMYKVAAEEYKAYLLTLEETPKLPTSCRRKHSPAADPNWEADRRTALSKQRRSMLAQMNHDPLQRPMRVVSLRPDASVRTVTVRPRGVVLESS
jgi:hypothetical protein